MEWAAENTLIQLWLSSVHHSSYTDGLRNVLYLVVEGLPFEVEVTVFL